MKNKLQKIIQKAIDNGWKEGKEYTTSIGVVSETSTNPNNSRKLFMCDMPQMQDCIIFNHSFAKAYFKDNKVFSGDKPMVDMFPTELFKIHLQQLALLETTEERIDYLVKYLWN